MGAGAGHEGSSQPPSAGQAPLAGGPRPIERADLGPRVLAAAGYALFLLLAVDQAGRGPLQGADPVLLGWVPHQGPLFVVSEWVTHIGDPATVTAVALLGIGVLIGRQQYLEAGVLALAKAVSVVVVYGLKFVFSRPRPLVGVGDGACCAFPSGHATETAMVLMLLAVLLFEKRRQARPWAEGAAVGIALVVAASRVVLGVHWPMDVLAGLGLGWGLAGSFLLVRTFLQGQESLPHVAPSNEVAHTVGLYVSERIKIHEEASFLVQVEDVSEDRPLPSASYPLHPKKRRVGIKRFVAGEHGPRSTPHGYKHIGDGC